MPTNVVKMNLKLLNNQKFPYHNLPQIQHSIRSTPIKWESNQH